MIHFEQLRDPELGCLSYLVGDTATGEALVVDALSVLGADAYIMEAARRGLVITEVIDTHVHADHLSLGPELAHAAGVPYRMGEGAEVAMPFTPLSPGEEIRLGELALTVLPTPGHTPEAVSLAGREEGRGGDPSFVLTGDSLFVGDVARPDLVLEGPGEDVRERARALYHSLHDVLLTLPDFVAVFPGHFGASACGGQNMSGMTSSTVGFERRHNLALRARSEEEFISFVMATLKAQPTRYQEIKKQNMGGVVGHA